MSRWLKSVNTLLDQLDGQVGDAVVESEVDDDYDDEEEDEEYLYESDDDDLGVSRSVASPSTAGAGRAVDDILTKRGLHHHHDDDGDREESEVSEEEEEEEGGLVGDDDEEEIDFGTGDDDDEGGTRGGESAVFRSDEVSSPPQPAVEEDRSSEKKEIADIVARSSSPSASAQDEKKAASPAAVVAGNEALQSPLSVPSSKGESVHGDGGGDDDEESSSSYSQQPAPPTDSNEEDEEAASNTKDHPDTTSTATSLQIRPAEKQPASSDDATTPAVASTIRALEAEITKLQTLLTKQTSQTQKYAQSNKQSQKEVRKLRKTVVNLNDELEHAEREMDAQRTELERAAERMERDRVRNKEVHDQKDGKHKEEIAAMKSDHETTLKSLKDTHAEQLGELQQRLRQAEEARAREGGDWQGELAEAVQREQDGIRKVILLEDEKSTLTSQVSTLQTQITSLQSRLDTMTENCTSSTERERDAEDRLDAALSLHARQLSQRQAREAELERTVADLGAALVVARQREQNRLNRTGSLRDSTAGHDGSGGGQDTNEDADSVRRKLASAVEEVETLKAQLALERQHTATLHQELRDASKERSEEAATLVAKQRQHDRQVADLTSELSQLKSRMRDMEEEATKAAASKQTGTGGLTTEEGEVLRKEVASVSGQVLRQQKKLDAASSEQAALRSRLRAALSRAEVAEKAVAASSGIDTSGDLFDLESGPSRSISMGGGRAVRRRPRGPNSNNSTLRSAMNLQKGRVGERAEKVGNAIDALDKWTVETGTFLRYNPLARGAFILYLVLLHLWALTLLMFHAHSFEEVHGDFGDHHGPHQIVASPPHQGGLVERFHDASTPQQLGAAGIAGVQP